MALDDSDRLDLQLMQNGAVTLYFRTSILEEDLAWLRYHGYAIETVDCRDPDDFQRQVSCALKFKEQFGYEPWTGNLNALNDALRYLDIACESGLAFCFLRYDLLCEANPDFAEGVLNMFELNSRDHLVAGRRLMALVQSDDPGLHFAPLGARRASWNRREWLDKNRGL